ncbi:MULTISPECIES: copper amine oxidase [Pontibacillus]|uniref:Copper amine oxidase n=1 Tax=Pontibacillus chungwhensis TaxID=265426 RepID=A0ABY8UZS2_9BACI|nr:MULTISPECIES: copper amine oxidase [Pontibacillus]MCD5324508.1 copper amine oxidase [Pontibacillus sp. HN14]WIF99197.1 copper amine oxidase [Pontibacillus chungwhensis]
MKLIKKVFALTMALLLLVPSVSMAHAESGPTAKTPAADLRATLSELLSNHFVYQTISMTKTYDDAEDTEAINQALERNANDLTKAIQSIYGKEGAAQFEKIFDSQYEETPGLAEAVKSGDKEAEEKAKQQLLQQFPQELGTFLSEATGGNLPADTAEKVLRAHEQDVQDVFYAYVNEDYKKAYQSFRTGFDRMFDISKALSGAIVNQKPDQFNHTKVDTKAADLRSTLNSLASEHFALATLEMQKGFDQAKDYDFVTWAEDQQTADFKGAIASIYGQEAADQFEKIWQKDHIAAQSKVVAATLQEQNDERKDAEQRLKDFSQQFGMFLSQATEGNLPEDAAKEAIWMHEEDVLQTFDQYVNGEYEATYESFDEGFAYMFGVGEMLSEAVVTSMPDEYSMMPSEMPDTGLGGSEQNGFLWMWITFASLVVLSGGVLASRSNKKA